MKSLAASQNLAEKKTGTRKLSKKNLAQASCLPSTPARARSPRAQPHSHWWWAPVEDDVGDDDGDDVGDDVGDDDLYDFKTTFPPLFPPPLMEGAAAGGEKIRKIFETADTHKQTNKQTHLLHDNPVNKRQRPRRRDRERRLGLEPSSDSTLMRKERKKK